ncbi:MAG: Asp/Glu racemase [Pseudomonadota bacterium]
MNWASRGRAKLGVFVPFTNTNLEADLAMLCPAGVTFHSTRLGGYDIDEIPDEKHMAQLGASSLDEELRLLGGLKPDVIIYGCTSATLAHGPDFDRELAQKSMDECGIPMVTAAGALVHALNTLGVKKVGFSSPYVRSLNADAIRFLNNSGFDVVSDSAVESELNSTEQGALTPDDVVDLACSADSSDAEALVLSCTDLRAVEAVERIESQLGKPVVTSNQALLFQALQNTQVPTSEVSCGRLFQTSQCSS